MAFIREGYQATLSQVEAILDTEALERAWNEGGAMVLEQAIGYALAPY